jgi:predicted DNA-binding transcriptional regulator AlpA
MLEVPEWIVSQNDADWITGTDNATRRRQEAKGTFPQRFQITENGATGYLWSEIAAWIAARAANRTLSQKTAAASAALAERRRSAAGLPRTEEVKPAQARHHSVERIERGIV